VSQDREERLQQYLDGRLNASEREALEQELLADPEFLTDAYDEITVREALAEAAQAHRAAFRPKRKPQAVAFLAVAAVASIAFVAFILPRPGGEEIFRGDEAGAPQAVQPVGDLEGPPHMFIWTSDPTAARYRLEIFTAEGTRLHVTTTADTFLATSGGLALPRAGTWRATTIDSVGVGVRSTGDVEFSY